MKNLSIVLLFASVALLVTVQCQYDNDDSTNDQDLREDLLMQLQDAVEDQDLKERFNDYNPLDRSEQFEDLEERSEQPDDFPEEQRSFDSNYRQVERSYDPEQDYRFDAPYEK